MPSLGGVPTHGPSGSRSGARPRHTSYQRPRCRGPPPFGLGDRPRGAILFLGYRTTINCWISISPRCDLRTRVTRMCASCHIPLTCKLLTWHITLALHMTWTITHDVSNYTILHVTCHITVHYTHVYIYSCQLALCWQR